MGRAGVGLKPLIALYLALLLGATALLVGLAAVRLSRHAAVAERLHAGRMLLAELAGQLDDGRLRAEGAGDLAAWARSRSRQNTGLRLLSVLDAQGRLLASSDPDQRARELWGALGQQAPQGPAGEGWWVAESAAERLLLIEQPAASGGWLLRGAFGLARTDAAARRVAASTALYGGLVVVGLALIGWLLLYRLVLRPLDRLLELAGQVSQHGDLSWLLAAERSGSELGRLGLSLGRMARRIEDDQGELRRQIAEQERLNRELQQAQQAMLRQEKLASVGLLAAGLAHEVGNPMSAIVGYVDMLRSEPFSDEERGQILARVARELERIDRIIQDLLAFSRPGRGRIEPCAPAALITGVIDLLRPQQAFKAVDCRVELAAELPPVDCDPDLVRQVLVNLLLNAADALQPGGALWVRAAAVERAESGLRWRGGRPAWFDRGELHQLRPPRDGRGLPADRPAVIFAVVDAGAGIEAAHLDRIFDPFFSTKEPGRGTGLGLAISHSAIASLGGEIWAWSRPGTGTQFAFWLPAAAPGDRSPPAD